MVIISATPKRAPQNQLLNQLIVTPVGPRRDTMVKHVVPSKVPKNSMEGKLASRNMVIISATPKRAPQNQLLNQLIVTPVGPRRDTMVKHVVPSKVPKNSIGSSPPLVFRDDRSRGKEGPSH